MPAKLDDIISGKVLGFIFGSTTGWHLFQDVSWKAGIIIISGVLGGAASVLGKYLMKSFLNFFNKDKNAD